LVKRPRVHQLHDDPRGAVLLDYVKDGHDARVAEPGCGLGLAERPLVGSAVIGSARHGDPDLFDRDIPVKQVVPAAPDDTHGPEADLAVQAITTGDQAAGPHSLHGRTIHAATAWIPVSGMRIRLYRRRPGHREHVQGPVQLTLGHIAPGHVPAGAHHLPDRLSRL